jgi:hypothetical protein
MSVSPTDLFGLEVLDLCLRRDRSASIVIGGRQFLRFGQRLRRDRRGPRGSRQRGRSGGKSNREFQKMTAFHDISLLERVM